MNIALAERPLRLRLLPKLALFCRLLAAELTLLYSLPLWCGLSLRRGLSLLTELPLRCSLSLWCSLSLLTQLPLRCGLFLAELSLQLARLATLLHCGTSFNARFAAFGVPQLAFLSRPVLRRLCGNGRCNCQCNRESQYRLHHDLPVERAELPGCPEVLATVKREIGKRPDCRRLVWCALSALSHCAFRTQPCINQIWSVRTIYARE